MDRRFSVDSLQTRRVLAENEIYLSGGTVQRRRLAFGMRTAFRARANALFPRQGCGPRFPAPAALPAPAASLPHPGRALAENEIYPPGGTVQRRPRRSGCGPLSGRNKCAFPPAGVRTALPHPWPRRSPTPDRAFRPATPWRRTKFIFLIRRFTIVDIIYLIFILYYDDLINNGCSL